MYYHYGKWDQVVLFSEVTNVLSLWEVGFMTCPLFRGCLLFRVSTMGGSTVHSHVCALIRFAF